MNNLYRRIVTMGMISFSAILAWVYCILAFREKTVYVVSLSLVLVISLYALLNSIVSLHLSKQDDLRKYIYDTVNATLVALVSNPDEKQAEIDRAIEAERLAKATYVQLRKVNSNLTSLAEANSYNSIKSIDNYTALTLSLKEAVTDAISNTAKVIIKYNKTDNQNIIEALNDLTEKMQGITLALDEISTRIDSINIVAQPHTKTVLEDSVMDDMLPDGIDVFSMTTNPPKDLTPDISEEEESAAVNSFFDEFETKDDEANAQVEEATDNTDDPNKMLSQDDIAALFASAMPAAEEKEPEPEVTASVDADPNRQLTPDEIAALFNASKEERTAKSTEDFERENLPEAMDQNLIDALLGNLDAEAAIQETTPETLAEEEDKIIPFPVNEDTAPEEPAPIAEEFDPNRQLSADEIAALFASINGGN